MATLLASISSATTPSPTSTGKERQTRNAPPLAYKRSFGGASGLPHQTPGKSRNFGKLARIMALVAVFLSVVMVCPYTLCTGAETVELSPVYGGPVEMVFGDNLLASLLDFGVFGSTMSPEVCVQRHGLYGESTLGWIAPCVTFGFLFGYYGLQTLLTQVCPRRNPQPWLHEFFIFFITYSTPSACALPVTWVGQNMFQGWWR